MTDYIKRDDAINAFYTRIDKIGVNDPRADGLYIAGGIIENLHAADVVEVVRCKYCRDWCCVQRNSDGEEYGYCMRQKMKRSEVFFCRDGKRRDDGKK